jgi:hypothetical protein
MPHGAAFVLGDGLIGGEVHFAAPDNARGYHNCNGAFHTSMAA